MPQTREQGVATRDEVAKRVRAECGLPRESKALVDIETGRPLGWTGAVALRTLCPRRWGGRMANHRPPSSTPRTPRTHGPDGNS